MIKRLAEKWIHAPLTVDSDEFDDARWWLNAIADEIEDNGVFDVMQVDWLRSQAQESPDVHE